MLTIQVKLNMNSKIRFLKAGTRGTRACGTASALDLAKRHRRKRSNRRNHLHLKLISKGINIQIMDKMFLLHFFFWKIKHFSFVKRMPPLHFRKMLTPQFTRAMFIFNNSKVNYCEVRQHSEHWWIWLSEYVSGTVRWSHLENISNIKLVKVNQ